MTPPRAAMLLAAGLGSRLRPLTDATPKPLINVGGTPVILRSLVAIHRAGVQRVVINTHYHARMVEDTVRAHAPTLCPGLQVLFSREETLLETGGGIKKALPLLGENPFLVVNADAVWLEETTPILHTLITEFNAKKHDVLMGVVPTKNTREFRPEGGDLTFNPRTKHLTFPANVQDRLTHADAVYMGIHITHPAFIAFEQAERFSLSQPWREAAAQGRLHGHMYKAAWVDMGTHTGLAIARRLLSPQKF
jgi:MurNAc alpha-1-phosphate uridylyltransferase